MLVFTEPTIQGAAADRPGAERLAESACFDRIADRRAGAVRLDVADRRRIDAGAAAGGAHQRRLRRRARQRETVRAPVLVRRGAADRRIDAVAVTLRRGQRLQHHDTGALAANEAIRRRVEGATAASRRQHGHAAEGDERHRRQQRVDAADQRERARAVPQAFAGEVHRDQRRRARRVDGQARPTQIEAIGDAVGGDARARRPWCCRCRCRCARRDSIAAARSRESRCRRTLRSASRATPPATWPPSSSASHAVSSKHPLLRIHERRLARRDAEEIRIEAVDVVDEAAPASDRFAGLDPVSDRSRRRRSSDRTGTSLTASTPLDSSRQNASGPMRASRKSTTDADDCDGFSAQDRNFPRRRNVRLGRPAGEGALTGRSVAFLARRWPNSAFRGDFQYRPLAARTLLRESHRVQNPRIASRRVA